MLESESSSRKLAIEGYVLAIALRYMLNASFKIYCHLDTCWPM